MDIKILAKNNKLLLDAFINELQHFIDDDKQFHFEETLNEPRSLFINTKVRKVRYESDIYPSKADEYYYIPDEWYEAITTIKKALDKQEAEESEVNFEKGKWYVEHTSTFDKWVFRYTKTESHKIYGSNSVFIDDSEITLDSSREVWLENIDRRCIRPATDEEVEQALKLIAKELGYKDGTKIRYSVFDISTEAYQLKEPFMLGYNYEAGYFLQDKKGLTFYVDIGGWAEKAEFYEDEHQVGGEMYVNGEKATFPCVINKGDEILLKTNPKLLLYEYYKI